MGPSKRDPTYGLDTPESETQSIERQKKVVEEA